ncbi:MAG: helix-turn-helix domain-containing protein [Bacteroidota bacterium]
MKHVSILVPKRNAILSNVVGAYKVLHAANRFLRETGRANEDFFDVKLVGLNKETLLYDGAFAIKCHNSIDEVDQTDLILIPAFRPDYIFEELELNDPYIPWILEQRTKHNTEIASMCLGAFVLAKTGLMNGRQCATHWAGMDIFRGMFPKVDLVSNRIVTEEDGLYSSGGAFSFLNLMLHLVAKYCGKATAIYLSKFFEIEIDREDQHQFAIFRGQKDHNDEVIRKAQEYIEQHSHQKISVDDLARKSAMSNRSFVRRFKKATQNTPLEYIQRVKIEVAKRCFESTTQNVNEVMYSVGYLDEKAFRTVFKKYVGLSPVSYKNKYNRNLAEFGSPTAW